MPQISVIIPCWNRANFLTKAIDSVLSQGCQDFELLIVDDGSSDDTQARLAEYGSRLKIIKHRVRQGPAAARNSGIVRAKGEFISFLDSDDWWHKDKLEQQLLAMLAHPGYLVSHTDEVWYRRGVLLKQKKKHARPHGFIFNNCLPLCCVGMSTVMVRRDFFTRIGLFSEDLPCCEDYELWLRAAITLPFLKINAALTYKNGGRSDQVSQQYRQGMDRFRIQGLLKIWQRSDLSSEQRHLVKQELQRRCLIYGNGCRKHGREERAAHYLDLAQRLAGNDLSSSIGSKFGKRLK